MNIYTLSQDLKDHPTRTLRTCIVLADNEEGALAVARNMFRGDWYVIATLVQTPGRAMLIHTYLS
jgi:hypothetical protein